MQIKELENIQKKFDAVDKQRKQEDADYKSKVHEAEEKLRDLEKKAKSKEDYIDDLNIALRKKNQVTTKSLSKKEDELNKKESEVASVISDYEKRNEDCVKRIADNKKEHDEAMEVIGTTNESLEASVIEQSEIKKKLEVKEIYLQGFEAGLEEESEHIIKRQATLDESIAEHKKIELSNQKQLGEIGEQIQVSNNKLAELEKVREELWFTKDNVQKERDAAEALKKKSEESIEHNKVLKDTLESEREDVKALKDRNEVEKAGIKQQYKDLNNKETAVNDRINVLNKLKGDN